MLKLFTTLIVISLYIHAGEIKPYVLHNSPEGIQRLNNSKSKIDFFYLSQQFEPQQNKIFCGVATAVIILNTLRLYNPKIKKPSDQSLLLEKDRKYISKKFNPIFERYTQNTIFLSNTKKILEVLGKPITMHGKQIKDFGFQVRQLHQLFLAHGLKSTLRIVNDKINKNKIKDELIANMRSKDDYVIVNFKREGMAQKGGGHISPLGAYDSLSDSFLILDVNPNKYGWFWVKTDSLINAMKIFDTFENRGYILVSENH